MRVVITLWLLAFAVLVGCDSRGEPESSGEAVRIVSLSPAVTQMVIDLGYGSKIVGAGAHDPVAPPGVEVVGDLLQLDYEKLIRVRPTHVFLQPGTRGAPRRLEELCRAQSWQLSSFDIETIDDAMAVLFRPSAARRTETVGGALGVEDRAERLVLEVRGKLRDLERHLSKTPVERVLLVIGASPMTVAASGTFLDELLRVAGGRNVIESSEKLYPTIDLERVVTLAPEVVIFVHSTTGQMGQGKEKLESLLAGLEIPAVKNGRIYEVFDRVALLPSTSMPRVAGKLATALHPKSRDWIAAALSGEELR